MHIFVRLVYCSTTSHGTRASPRFHTPLVISAVVGVGWIAMCSIQLEKWKRVLARRNKMYVGLDAFNATGKLETCGKNPAMKARSTAASCCVSRSACSSALSALLSYGVGCFSVAWLVEVGGGSVTHFSIKNRKIRCSIALDDGTQLHVLSRPCHHATSHHQPNHATSHHATHHTLQSTKHKAHSIWYLAPWLPTRHPAIHPLSRTSMPTR